MAVNPGGLQAAHPTLQQSLHIVQASPGSAREWKARAAALAWRQRFIRKGMTLREITTGCCKFAMRRLSTEPVEGSTELLRFRQDV